jgi:hypothetical protein
MGRLNLPNASLNPSESTTKNDKTNMESEKENFLRLRKRKISISREN